MRQKTATLTGEGAPLTKARRRRLPHHDRKHAPPQAHEKRRPRRLQLLSVRSLRGESREGVFLTWGDGEGGTNIHGIGLGVPDAGLETLTFGGGQITRISRSPQGLVTLAAGGVAVLAALTVGTNSETKRSPSTDLDHPPGIEPHCDLRSRGSDEAYRVLENGSAELKIK